MKKVRVCVVTGSRAEFGIWANVLQAMDASRVLDLKLIVTGMHLLKEFGATIRDIEAAGFRVAARVEMYGQAKSGPSAAADDLARGIVGLAAAYRDVGADIVMVLGDRLEMLAAASAALTERLPMAHVHGGETAPGIWDEQIRHAITKMAQVHFCATEKSGARIRRMGEPKDRVHVVGAPALDAAKDAARKLRKVSKLRGNAPLIVLHPSSADAELEYQRALQLIDSLRQAFPDAKLSAIGPNNDPGHAGILRAYAARHEFCALTMSVNQAEFWKRLAASAVLVGNSSAGVIEAATFGVPVINLGNRQAGRERNANVIDVPWEKGPAGIRRAIQHVLGDKSFARRVAQRKNIYGDGHTSGRIVRVLESLAKRGLPLEKRFAD